MNYTRPEIIAVTSAVKAIQGGEKGPNGVQEMHPPYQLTIGAYEADE